jgi:hypothetical protein
LGQEDAQAGRKVGVRGDLGVRVTFRSYAGVPRQVREKASPWHCIPTWDCLSD